VTKNQKYKKNKLKQTPVPNLSAPSPGSVKAVQMEPE